jgi:hypothetical protein
MPLAIGEERDWNLLASGGRAAFAEDPDEQQRISRRDEPSI